MRKHFLLLLYLSQWEIPHVIEIRTEVKVLNYNTYIQM